MCTLSFLCSVYFVPLVLELLCRYQCKIGHKQELEREHSYSELKTWQLFISAVCPYLQEVRNNPHKSCPINQTLLSSALVSHVTDPG